MLQEKVEFQATDTLKDWEDVLTVVIEDDEHVIVRQQGEAIAVVIPYADYLALEDKLEDVRDARVAAKAYAAWKRDPSQARPYEQIREELVAEGLLDDLDE